MGGKLGRIRALWLVRPDLTRAPGGDTTQILEAARALRLYGIQVSLRSEIDVDLSRFDLVHLFHLDRVWENVHWCRQIRATGIPSVLSPIYWPTDEFDQKGRTGVARRIERIAGSGAYYDLKLWYYAARQLIDSDQRRSLHAPALRFERGRQYVLDTVQALLPNSAAEREVLRGRFALKQPIFVVPNAVNTEHFSPPPAGPAYGAPARDKTVLCVGRIEPRKNQLSVIRALSQSGLRLRIIGRAGDHSRSYEQACRREAGPAVEFLGWRSPVELRRWYRVSAAHVSASWYETPGLASLEAASCGCPVVVTPGGATREYFGADADYCTPDDPESIRAAVESSLARPSSPELGDRIAKQFTWQIAAHETLRAYRSALKERAPQPARRARLKPALKDSGEYKRAAPHRAALTGSRPPSDSLSRS